MQTNLHQIHLARITSPFYLVFVWPESAAAPKTLAVVAEGATFLHDFIAAICLKPFIFGGFESPVQLNLFLLPLFVPSTRKEDQCCQQFSEEEALDGRE